MHTCKICNKEKTVFLYQIKKYKYYLCKYCESLSLYPKPSIAEISKYYGKDFEYAAGFSRQDEIRRRSRIIIKTLKKLNPLGVNLLDVGSGYGFLLDESQKQNIETLGLEPSKKLYNSQFNKRSQVSNIDFFNFYKQNKYKKFDFITMVHVIEHLSDPAHAINLATDLLKINGILYIETPNLDSHLFYAERGNYTFLTPPDHLWILSRKSFFNMLKGIPKLKIVKLKTYTYPEHFMGIMKIKLRNKKKSKLLNVKTTLSTSLQKNSVTAGVKIALLDNFAAKIFTPFLNIGHKGSILELYMRKLV